MAQWLKKIEQLLSGGEGGTKRVRTFRWLLLVGLVGVALMLLNSYFGFAVKDVDLIADQRTPSGALSRGQDNQPTFGSGSSQESSLFRDYEQAYESRLRDLLEKIVGVGETEVLVTIDSTEEIVVEKNWKETQRTTNERDQNSSTRNITEVTRDGQVVLYQISGGNQPLILKTIKPKVRGVVIVANGAENLTVKKLILEAVERGLGVPAHRISIVPRKQ